MRNVSLGKPPGKEQWRTAGEIARLLGVHITTFERRLRAGKLPANEAVEGGWRLWSPEQVREILKSA